VKKTDHSTLLLLGGSHSEVPLINAAKQLGYRVVTTGNRETDAGHNFSDGYQFGDYSNSEEMLAIAKELDITAVCSGCNDFAAITASEIATTLNLGGHDSPTLARSLHNKDLFYKLALDHNFPVPNSQYADSQEAATAIAADIGYPVIVKPVDLTGGKGISVAHSKSDIEDSWSYAMKFSRHKKVLVQKFLVGTNHAISTLISNKRVVFSFIDNEHYFANKYLVGAASYPSTIPATKQDQIRATVEKFAGDLELSDGLLHFQFIFTESQEFFFIDSCRRAPGDLYIRFVELATGYPYPSQIVCYETNRSLAMQALPEPQEKFFARICLMPTKSGTYLQTIDLSGPGTVIERTTLLPSGATITDPTTQKVEIVQMSFESISDMIMISDDPTKRFDVQVE
jgi:biotin carboxylase